MKKTITLPASVQEYFVVQGNEVFQWYRIPASQWVAGMPPAVLVPVSLPSIQKVKVTKKFVTITFLLETEEEQRAWKHTKAYIHEVFGVEEQPKRFSFFGAVAAAAAVAVGVGVAVIGISANAERAIEVCTKQAAALNKPVTNAYGVNLCERDFLYQRSMQKQYDKLSK